MEKLLAYGDSDDDNDDGAAECNERPQQPAAVQHRRKRSLDDASSSSSAEPQPAKRPCTGMPPPPPDMLCGPSEAEKLAQLEKHQGRTRSFAHVPGNYPSFVSLALQHTTGSPEAEAFDAACDHVCC